MRKKFTIYLILCITTLTFFFCVISYIMNSIEEKRILRENLETNGNILKGVFKEKDYDIRYMKKILTDLNDETLRYTLIDSQGDIIFDNIEEAGEDKDYNKTFEIIEARDTGFGYAIRKNHILGKTMMHYALNLEKGNILRVSKVMQETFLGNKEYLEVYFLLLFIITIFVIVIAIRISDKISKPIEELKVTATRIANGDLERRVQISSEDEFGEFSRLFNIMAGKLEEKINELTEKQNTLSAIISSMENGVIAIDNQDNVILINNYAEELFYVKGNSIGKKLITVIRDEEIETIIKSQENTVKKLKIITPKKRELRVKTTVIRKGYEIIGKVAVVSDITDINKLENMRYRFMTNVSHELKTPLTSIKGFAETLKFVKEEEKRDKFLDIINEEADRLTGLINDILTLSDIESSSERIKDKIDVGAIINHVYLMVTSIASKKNISCTIDIKDDIILIGDGNRFKQMVLNLVDNAIKYSEYGDSVKVVAEKIDNNLILTVEDTGIGIEKKHIKRLFERFYRVDKARSRNSGGTGLGLAIVKHITQSFNGEIKVSSKVNIGTKFTVVLPLKE